MGAQIAKYLKKEPPRVILLGLDAAGKTTLMYKMKGRNDEVVTTIPTIGMNVETLEMGMIGLTAMDLGGRCPMRGLMRHYYGMMDAAIFVVDSNDVERLEEVRREVDRLLQEEEMRGKPVLFLANKQDLPNALGPVEITERLGLNAITDRQWFIEGSVAITGNGFYEGLEWLLTTVAKKKMADRLTAPLKETVADGKKLSSEGGMWGRLKSLLNVSIS